MTTVSTPEELGEALKNNVNTIEIKGDLAKKVIVIKATGNVAWGLLICCLTVAILSLPMIAISPTAPATSIVKSLGISSAATAFSSVATSVSVGVSGASVAVTAVLIGAAGGGIAALNKLRKYELKERSNSVMLKLK